MLLEVKNVTVCYDSIKAINNVSFNVAKGEIVTLIGPNGAGKSTALKAVFGLLNLNAGKILFKGRRIDQLRPDQRSAIGISLFPEGRRIFPSMTVLENIEMGCFNLKGINTKLEIERIFEYFPDLKKRKDFLGGSLSTGEQQMLAMGRAIIQRPKLLLADEPSAGLSPSNINSIFEKLIEISKQGISILLVEQHALLALEIADRGYVFNTGKIHMSGTSNNITNNKEIKKMYLGGI